jgi:hypothetical protein
MTYLTITFLDMQTTMSSASGTPASIISLNKEDKLGFHKVGIPKLVHI